MLILLDIDGVMVPASSWKIQEFMPDGFAVFNARATLSLNKIIAATNATIVLTTSHKASYTLTHWKKMLASRNINVASICSLQDNIENLSRKDEILLWFENNAVHENFVIIDDDKSLNGLPENLKEKLILTSSLVGLTLDQADDAILILQQEKISR